jgi:hypothetical protein
VQRGFELSAGADVELREDLVQVPFDGARAEEQLRADLRVRVTVARELRDLGLLGREVVAAFRRTLADRLAGGHQLSTGALVEGFHVDRGEHVERRAQLLARAGPASRLNTVASATPFRTGNRSSLSGMCARS